MQLEAMSLKADRLLVVLVPLLGACYMHAPLDFRTIPPADTRIVAQVTDTGVLAMSSALGPGAREVEGIVAGADAASWDLRLMRVDYRGGTSVIWKGEQVRFPRSALSQASTRRFSKGRSWVLAGLITSSALLAARFLGVIGGGRGNDQTEPPN
jgi:hypothetical protein